MPTTLIDPSVQQALIEQLAKARQQSDELFAIVHPDALYDRPIAERHRIVFYIGHLEAFDWNLLHDRVLGLKTFHPEFDRLFAFGIDPVGGGLPADQPSEWPQIAAVNDYVQKIRAAMDIKLHAALDSGDSAIERQQSGGFSLNTFLNVAVEHRLMHAETLAYMLHQLPLDRKIHEVESLDLDNPPVDHRGIEIPAGSVTLGLQRDSGVFGWDNEFETQTFEIPAFSIDKYKVTNRQYLEFIEANGYRTLEYWGAEDWRWISENQISHPAFWKRDPIGNWLYCTMFENLPLPLDWPVYVSQAEAKAFAKWAGKSLPTEAEWQRAAFSVPGGDQRLYPWGSKSPSPDLGNFNFERWSPAPVNAFASSKSAYGVQGMVGNGWEWTSSEFAPFPGFEAFPFYPAYSANFFDGKHFVMKGGSARTAACMLRPTFRNWFQAHYQFIYTGFRCVSR